MENKELKHEFELERIILFSDAVFAIIITIMVLEVKLPDTLRHAKPGAVNSAILGLLPKLAAYMVSFFLVSVFWVRHLKIFKTLSSYDIPLVARNLIFLFIISLFPFAISVLLETLSPHNLYALDFYISVIMLGIFFQTVLVNYIIKHKQQLCHAPHSVEDALKWKVYRSNYLLIPIVFLLLVLLNIIGMVILSGYVIVIYGISMRLLQRKFYPKIKG